MATEPTAEELAKPVSVQNLKDVQEANEAQFMAAESYQSLRNNMGLGNTLGALPVANGGTGVTDVSELLGPIMGDETVLLDQVLTSQSTYAANFAHEKNCIYILKIELSNADGSTDVRDAQINVNDSIKYAIGTDILGNIAGMTSSSSGNTTLASYNNGNVNNTGTCGMAVYMATHDISETYPFYLWTSYTNANGKYIHARATIRKLNF